MGRRKRQVKVERWQVESCALLESIGGMKWWNRSSEDWTGECFAMLEYVWESGAARVQMRMRMMIQRGLLFDEENARPVREKGMYLVKPMQRRGSVAH